MTEDERRYSDMLPWPPRIRKIVIQASALATSKSAHR